MPCARTRQEFQYVDEDGKDQGVNVRIKSKDVAALLTVCPRPAAADVPRQGACTLAHRRRT